MPLLGSHISDSGRGVALSPAFGLPPTGVIAGPMVAPSRPGSSALRLVYEHFVPIPGNLQLMAAAAFRNGSLAGIEEAPRSCVEDVAIEWREGELLLDATGADYEAVELLPLQRCGAWSETWGDTTLMWRPVLGDRALLTWSDEPTAADFACYVIYWDAGAGGDCDEELTTISRRRARSYLTGSLSEGTFQFAITYRDTVGNERAVDAGEVQTVTTRAHGDWLDFDGDWSIDAASWTLSIVGLPENTAIYANEIPHLYTKPRLIYWGRPFAIHRSGSTWTSQGLRPGLWRLAFVERTADGVPSIVSASDFDGSMGYLEFSLVDDGAGGLALVDSWGADPCALWALPGSGATIDLSWRADGSGWVEVWARESGGAWALEATLAVATTSYEFSGVEGTDYEFKIRAKQTTDGHSAFGEWSETVSASADGTAPSGDQVIVATVVA